MKAAPGGWVPGGAVTAPPAPAAVGTGLRWPHCPCPQLSLARSARPCLSVASPLPRRPAGPGARSRPRAAAGTHGHWLPPPGRLWPWHRPGPLFLHPALVPAPLSGRGHPVLPSRALGFAWGWGRAGGEAAPAAALPWQGSLPGARGQPSMGKCPLTFQSWSSPPCPAPPDAEHKALRPPPRHAGCSQGSCLLLPWPASVLCQRSAGGKDGPSCSPAPHCGSLWVGPSVVAASCRDPGGPPRPSADTAGQPGHPIPTPPPCRSAFAV